jgi:putative molybdopterin biosynthesis protein
MAQETPTLLTAAQLAELLQVSPKNVYRLVRKGLPGRRVGGEWRFLRGEVLAWLERGKESAGSPGGSGTAIESQSVPIAANSAPPFLAANGDVAVERLLAALNAERPILGFIQADTESALGLLERGAVLAAGSHGKGPPGRLGEIRVARIHLVRREVGLVAPAGSKPPALSALGRLRFAARPTTAGVSALLERAVAGARLDYRKLMKRAILVDSHRDVVCAVARGEADVGLATRAWADRLGLAFRALEEESYGLLVRAGDLGDPRVVRLCEIAHGDEYRRALASIRGYDATDAGSIRYDR